MKKYSFEENMEKEFYLMVSPTAQLISEVRERSPHKLKLLSIGKVEEELGGKELRYIFKINSIKYENDLPVLEGVGREYDLHRNRVGKEKKLKVYIKELLEEMKEEEILCF